MTAPLTAHREGQCRAVIGEVTQAEVATYCCEPAIIAPDGRQLSWCEHHFNLYTLDPSAPRVRSHRTNMVACESCGKQFHKKGYQSRYCSDECYRKKKAERNILWKAAQKAKAASNAVDINLRTSSERAPIANIRL
jgi:hypothetical protein